MTEFSDQWKLSCPCNKIILNSRNVHERHWGYNYMNGLMSKWVMLVPVIVSMYASKLLPLKCICEPQATEEKGPPHTALWFCRRQQNWTVIFFFSCVLICKQWSHICRITDWVSHTDKGAKQCFIVINIFKILKPAVIVYSFFIRVCIYLHTCSMGHLKNELWTMPTVNIVDSVTSLHDAVRGSNRPCCKSGPSLFCSDDKNQNLIYISVI